MARITYQDDQGRIRERFLEVNQAGTKIDARTTLIDWIDDFLDTGAQGLTEVIESHATDRVFGQVAIHVFRLPITWYQYNHVLLQMMEALMDADIIDDWRTAPYPAENDPAPTSNTGLKDESPPPSGAGDGLRPAYEACGDAPWYTE